MRRLTTTEDLEARDRIVEAARALLAGEMDVLQAAARIATHVRLLDPKYEDPDLRLFVGVASETDKYLIVDSVRGWHPEVREAREEAYRNANDSYANDALRAASAVLEKLAPPA